MQDLGAISPVSWPFTTRKAMIQKRLEKLENSKVQSQFRWQVFNLHTWKNGKKCPISEHVGSQPCELKPTGSPTVAANCWHIGRHKICARATYSFFPPGEDTPRQSYPWCLLSILSLEQKGISPVKFWNAEFVQVKSMSLDQYGCANHPQRFFFQQGGLC